MLAENKPYAKCHFATFSQKSQPGRGCLQLVLRFLLAGLYFFSGWRIFGSLFCVKSGRVVGN